MSRRLTARGDRGQVVVLVALMIPVFLLLGALVVDAGNWYSHKRSLQNRADAGALAAGLEYIQNKNLKNCIGDPGGVGNTISKVAKAYAGTSDASVGTTYNKNVNSQADVTVVVNATSPTDADWTDGGGPCATTGGAHSTGDGWSSKGMWTDVKIREGNIGTLFGSFGISLPQIAAQARVKVEPIIGVGSNGLPFIAETGDQIECVWAQFVRARDGSTTGFTVTPSNPILLTETANHTWTGNVTNVQFTNAADDVAIRYWGGSRNGSTSCNFAGGPKKPIPHELAQDDLPVQIDWINVYDTGAVPGNQAPPKLRRFSLDPAGTCGGPGYLYTASTSPSATCLVGFTAEVDTGVNDVKGEITVDPHGTAVSPVTVPYDTTGAGSNLATVSGTITVLPNHTAGGSYIQNYDQVGPTYLSVSWHQLTGQVGTKICAVENCSGTFQGETVSGVADDIQQQFFTSDSLTSVPLVGTTVSTISRSYPALGSSGAFSITFQHTAVDPNHVVLIRDSGQQGPGTGNRTRSIYCGNSPGSGAQALENAIRDGCAKDLTLNVRQDSCSPAPLPSGNPWDCVQLEQGQKTSVSKGAEDRFLCTRNNWPTPPPKDQRWAYIILTGFGRTGGAPNGDWLPIEGLVRVYVTGWDQSGGGGGPASCSFNDDPPRGYDTQGAQIWGHIVEPITLDPAVIVGDGECDLTNDNVQCSPRLVR